MAACKPLMESNFASFNSKRNGLSLLLFLNNSSPKEFSRGREKKKKKKFTELCSMSLMLLPIK